MLVSFIVVAYNAGDKLTNLIEDIKKQDYNHKKVEVILVDSNSSDNTKKIIEDFSQSAHDFYRICVLENEKKTLPCGWNVALKESKGEIILRVDAHTAIPHNFVRKNVECIQNGEKICGGKVDSVLDDDKSWQKTLLLTENSAFGGGIAKFRRSEKARYVSTLAFAAYHREVFRKVGGYDERLARTEDNEMHYRMKKAGYKFLLNPQIKSVRYARNTLKKMVKQKYANGYWIGLTLSINPKCFEIYHFVPLVFILSIITTGLLGWLGFYKITIVFWIIYCLVNVLMSILAVAKQKFSIEFILLPFLFFLIHFSYGIGTLIGIIKIPVFMNKNKNYKLKQVIK